MGLKTLFVTLLMCILSVACGNDVPDPKQPAGGLGSGGTTTGGGQTGGGQDVPTEQALLVGADMSWATQLEAQGYTFYSWNHRDPMGSIEAQADMGMQALRLRVYVGPKDGYCSPEDVLQKALRARALGIPVMLDFAYADTIPDIHRHEPPSAWASHSYQQLLSDVYDHTHNVLQLMKDNGVDVRWVEVGDNICAGMLWPAGDPSKSPSQFKQLFRRASQAARAVFPDAQIVATMGAAFNHRNVINGLVMLDRDDYDVVGLHLFPTSSMGATFVSMSGTPTSLTRQSDVITFASQCVDEVYNRFRKPCILTEVGEPICNDPDRNALSTRTMQELRLVMKQNTTCLAAFYMEPESFDGWLDYHQGASIVSGKAVKPTMVWP